MRTETLKNEAHPGLESDSNLADYGALEQSDPEMMAIINRERIRQRERLQMIASENYVSPAVLAARGSALTNKYAEGYPGKRYYDGCEVVDDSEALAIERAKKLFNAEHANVQPHSGSQANQAAFFALLKPGDKILGLDLSHTGHLTHGSPVNFSGKIYEAHHYGVEESTGRIDYNRLRERALEVRPQMIIVGATAYPRDLDFATCRKIADEVGAFLMADIAHPSGLVAAGVHSDPVPHAHVVTMSTHKTLRGPRGGMVLCKADLAETVDKGVFPGIQGGPLEHVIAGKGVAFHEALQPSFKKYAARIVENASILANSLLARGIQLVSGGTDNHLVLVDLRDRDVSGKKVSTALNRAGITVNKNAVPFDKRKPWFTSGIRIGTAAITTRGMGPEEMRTIANWIVNIIEKHEDEELLTRTEAEVRELCSGFPLFKA